MYNLERQEGEKKIYVTNNHNDDVDDNHNRIHWDE